jgi:hypothetical protein
MPKISPPDALLANESKARFQNVENREAPSVRIVSSRIWTFTCHFFRQRHFRPIALWLDLRVSAFAVLSAYES